MPTLVEVVLFVGFSLLAALAGMLLVRRSVRLTTLEAHKESAGFVYATLGVAYAVLLTFVVVAVWEQFREAEETVEQEAASVSTLFHLAEGFSAPTRRDVQDTLVTYTRAVIDDEWSTLEHGKASDRAWSASDQLWRRYTAMPVSERAQVEYAQSLDQMRTFYALRVRRLLESRSTLPPIIWGVLLVGAVITIAFTYFFGFRSLAAQAVMTAALTIVLTSSLYLIYVLDNPYRGDYRVTPEAFQSGLDFFTRELGD